MKNLIKILSELKESDKLYDQKRKLIGELIATAGPTHWLVCPDNLVKWANENLYRRDNKLDRDVLYSYTLQDVERRVSQEDIDRQRGKCK